MKPNNIHNMSQDDTHLSNVEIELKYNDLLALLSSDRMSFYRIPDSSPFVELRGRMLLIEQFASIAGLPTTEKIARGFVKHMMERGALVFVGRNAYTASQRTRQIDDALQAELDQLRAKLYPKKEFERGYISKAIRNRVFKRDDYTCQHCGYRNGRKRNLHIDHVLPVSRGGSDDMDNLQVLCKACNLAKSNKLESEIE